MRLTLEVNFDILSKLARATEKLREGGSEGAGAGANLENDTEEVNAQYRKKTAKIPKSETRKC